MNDEFKEALTSGDASLIPNDLSVEESDTEEIRVAMRRAAEQVVFHRPNYRDVILKCIELGIPCDIWTASRAGILTHVEKLIAENHQLLEAEDASGQTPLQCAALVYGVCQECEEVVDHLIARGATVDIFSGSTFGIEDVVMAELARNPSIVSARCTGSTPLNWAVRPRRNYSAAPKICQALIDAGADVNDPDKYESGMTPLHHAAEWGPKICVELVDLLVAAGADTQAKDDGGWTALDYARDRNRSAMVSHLESTQKKMEE